MKLISSSRLLLLSICVLTPFLHATELKFAAPADLNRSLEPIVAPATLAVASAEGGFLRFHSDDKSQFCQMGLLSAGSPLKLADGEVTAKFRFGADKQSFGIYLRVSGKDDPAYLVLVSTWTSGQGIVRLFKVPPRAQVEDQHQLAKQAVAFPVQPGSWYVLRIKSATQGERSVQLSAALAPADSTGNGAIVTATDPSGFKDAGQLQVRFFTSEAEQNIDLKEISSIPAGGKSAGR